MNFNLIPRFNYTLPFYSYFRLRKNLDSDNDKIYFNSARTALRVLLSSISNKKLRVGVQAFTCHTVFQAINNAGHELVFIDINNSFQIDLDDLRDKISEIDVLIVTHTFGFPEQVKKIKEISGNKIVIEDCAHSFLSKYKNKFTGYLFDASIFSMGLAKFPPVGSGGYCIINEKTKFPFFEREYRKINKPNTLESFLSFIRSLLFSLLVRKPIYGLLTHRFGKKLERRKDLLSKFTFTEKLGYEWVEKVFTNNQKYFNDLLRRNIINAKHLKSLLGFNLDKEDCYSNYYCFPILTKNQDRLYKQLIKNNIESGTHFSKSISWAKKFGYKEGECAQTEAIINKILTLPIHAGVYKKDIVKMAEIVNKYG